MRASLPREKAFESSQLEGRAHREQVLDGDPVLARVRMRALARGKHFEDPSVDARALAAADGDPDEHPGDRLRDGPRVAEAVGVAGRVLLEHDLAAGGERHTRDRA